MPSLSKEALGDCISVTFIKGTRRPGYLLQHTGGDVQHALYCALYQSRAKLLNEVIPEKQQKSKIVPNVPEEINEMVIRDFSSLLHKQAGYHTRAAGILGISGYPTSDQRNRSSALENCLEHDNFKKGQPKFL